MARLSVADWRLSTHVGQRSMSNPQSSIPNRQSSQPAQTSKPDALPRLLYCQPKGALSEGPGRTLTPTSRTTRQGNPACPRGGEGRAPAVHIEKLTCLLKRTDHRLRQTHLGSVTAGGGIPRCRHQRWPGVVPRVNSRRHKPQIAQHTSDDVESNLAPAKKSEKVGKFRLTLQVRTR